MRKHKELKLFNKKEELIETVTTKLKETKDYVLLCIEEEDGYFIFNTVTQNLEDTEQKLPTALFQIDALQSALDKYRAGQEGS